MNSGARMGIFKGGRMGKYLIASKLALGLFVFSEPAFDKNHDPEADYIRLPTAKEAFMGHSSIAEYVSKLPPGIQKEIQKYIERYTKATETEAAIIQEEWKGISPYAEIYEGVADEHGIPREIFLALSLVESHGSINATSEAGAEGHFQFIKDTGEKRGLRIDHYIDERRDPEKASVAAAEEISYLRQGFESPEKAFAGYNMNACNLKKKCRDDGFWDCRGRLSTETKLFVPKILANAVILENPGKFKLNLGKESINFRHYTTESKDTVYKISKKLGISAKEIEKHNPQINNLNRIPPEIRIRYPVKKP